MAPEYRASLKNNFSYPTEHQKVVFWKTSQQVYFLLLADRFLNSGGKIAAVLPLTTFTGHAFHPLIRFLVSNYKIGYVIVGLGRSSFSEDTSLTECLFVGRKEKPAPGSKFKLIGISDRTEELTTGIIDRIVRSAVDGSSTPQEVVVREIDQLDLLPENSTLSTLVFRLDPDFEEAWLELARAQSSSRIPLIKVRDLFGRGVEVTEVYHGDYRPLKVGPKAIMGCRTEERALKDVDRLVFDRQEGDFAYFVDKDNPAAIYSFPATELAGCLRRFSYLQTIDISGKTDFIVSKVSPYLEKTMLAFYTTHQAKRFMQDIRRSKWTDIIRNGSSRINIMARVNLAAPGTIMLCYRASETVFLAGAYGYNVKGLANPRQEKLFTLWYNSSMSLIELLSKATVTQGTYMKFEQFTTERVTMPDPDLLTDIQWNRVEKLWDDVSTEPLPSLLTQLQDGNAVRDRLDVELLELVGLHHTEAQAVSKKLQRGALSVITLLRKTME